MLVMVSILGCVLFHVLLALRRYYVFDALPMVASIGLGISPSCADSIGVCNSSANVPPVLPFILKDFRSDFACFDLFIITLWLICCGSSLGAGSHRAKRSDKGLEQKNNRSVASGSFHRIALPHQVVVVQFVARILHAGHQLKATYVESAGKERQSSVATTVVC